MLQKIKLHIITIGTLYRPFTLNPHFIDSSPNLISSQPVAVSLLVIEFVELPHWDCLWCWPGDHCENINTSSGKNNSRLPNWSTRSCLLCLGRDVFFTLFSRAVCLRCDVIASGRQWSAPPSNSSEGLVLSVCVCARVWQVPLKLIMTSGEEIGTWASGSASWLEVCLPCESAASWFLSVFF